MAPKAGTAVLPYQKSMGGFSHVSIQFKARNSTAAYPRIARSRWTPCPPFSILRTRATTSDAILSRVHVISLLTTPPDLLNSVAPPFSASESSCLLFLRPFLRHPSQGLAHLLSIECDSLAPAQSWAPRRMEKV
jgi:hypothetical protein